MDCWTNNINWTSTATGIETFQTSIIINQEFFFDKDNADAIINLREYLIFNVIQEEHLEDALVLANILQGWMKRFVGRIIMDSELETFKRTILTFKIDHLKSVNLYRINRGVLLVVCVEYLLYPGKFDQEYEKIYRGNEHKATEAYNKLCNYPEQTPQDNKTVESARSFFECERFFLEEKCLETIRRYLRSIKIDPEEFLFIKNSSIRVINANASRMDTIDDMNQPISPENDSKFPPPKTVLSSLVSFVPPQVVSKKVNHVFSERYSPDQIALARMFDTNFWSA
ncbi:hypothetical protein TKK_0006660 [Trichogramma kaykai]|uniref:Uncharacterized protein n=1 Tax=Trichogramma kaykai TaxID=54128 RepID=A0ABD2XD29_9HYME